MNPSRLITFTSATASLLFVVFSSPVFGEVIVKHSGAFDPTTENWVDQGGNQSAGPISGDMGFDAWSIDDSSVALGSFRSYAHQLTNTQVTNAMSSGWQLSTRLRVIDTPDALDFSVSVGFNANTINYNLAFGTQADGDPIVQVVEGFSNPSSTGPSFALEGSGGGYHLYDLRFDPLSGTADLFVDGIERISNYSGNTINSGATQIQFGAAQSNSTGHANFNLVQFTAVPEPSSLTCFLFGGIGIVIRQRKRNSSL